MNAGQIREPNCFRDRLGRRRALRFAAPLGRELSAEREIQALAKQLDEAYRHTAAILPSHEDLRIRQINGKDRLSLTPLDKLDEPPSLLKLKDQVDSLLPRVDLPDAILEIHALTGFAEGWPASMIRVLFQLVIVQTSRISSLPGSRSRDVGVKIIARSAKPSGSGPRCGAPVRKRQQPFPAELFLSSGECFPAR